VSLAPPKLSVALAPGRKLDRYELLCPIAEGGMGVCWLARLQGKHGFEKLVAVKTMKSEYASDPEFERMFLDEARIASGIEHPNVAQILELGEHDDVLYLAMEYVDGDSLFKLRREVAAKSMDIPIGIVLRLLCDTLGGLHAAHELRDDKGVLLNVVHRDVSPQNILVSTRGAAKLIDFGIAKARDRSAGDTSTGTIKGKLHFMAPEQALGKPLDRRADVFSIGAILYYLCSGNYAYHGDTQAATILKLAEGKPPLPLPKKVPPPIASAIMRALSYDPAKRFETAAEMQQVLERAMASAGLATTALDVGAFVAEFLGHRAEKRKLAIEAAVEALARGSTGSVHVAEAPLTTNTSSVSGFDEAQAAAAGRLHTDPGGARTLDASAMMMTPPEPRRAPVFAVVGALSAIALVAGVGLIVVAMRRPAPAPPPEQAVTTGVGTAAPPVAESSTAPPAVAPSTTAVSDAPTVADKPVPPKPTATAVRTAAPPAPSGTTPKKRRRVDDGF
jgi:eukaryotic-like serine/threonine-protein kinase